MYKEAAVVWSVAASALDIDGNFMPFEMQPSQLTMNFSGTRSRRSRRYRCGTQQGQINLNGNADWSQIDNWRARVTAKAAGCQLPFRRWCAWMSRRMWSLTRRLRCSRWMGVWTFRGRGCGARPTRKCGWRLSDVVMLNNDLQPETQTASILHQQ